jgi:serine/threonine protein kinase/tetratricopeptide (TPR) repeat protein
MGKMVQQRQSAEKLFGDALDMEPGARGPFLDAACHDEPELRHLVEQLLMKDERAGSFLKKPLFDPSTKAGVTATGVRSTDTTVASARFKAGDMIAERFFVVRFIARGGMGEVYEVEDHLLDRSRVALKTVLPEIAADAEASHRFMQEVLLARQVSHPNLCQIYEIFRCDETPPAFLFLTMKLLAGDTLDSCIRKGLLIPCDEALEIFRQMIAGIAAIHGAGIVHRDIKPTNVMLDRSGHRICVSIMDFGLARNYESEATLYRPGTIAGTPGYLAPELIMGQPPSRASDLYALGVLLHQLLTGERPIESADGRLHPAPSLSTAPIPAAYVHAVCEFLSENPLVRCRAFEQIRALEESSSHRQRDPSSRVWTRRRMLMASGAAVCAVAGGVAWKHDRISDLFHPLPLKRFVALVGWPPSPDVGIRPMLINLIDSISSELARAEAYDHNLFLIPDFSSTDVSTLGQLNEVRESLGANLVLAASGLRSSKDLHVSLQVLEPSKSHPLRSKQIRVGDGEELSLAHKAVRAAAELLDIRHYEPSDKRIAAGTSNPEAYAAFQAAEALKKQNNDTGLEPAIEKYKQAIDLDRHYALATARLALAYCHLADVKHDPAATALARANAETALGMDPNLVPARMALAGALEQTGDQTSALREMKRALAVDPVNTQTLIWLGQSYARQNRWQSAEESFLRALQLRPNDWIAHNELGMLLYKQGKYLHALSEFRTAALASPKDVLTQSNVGSMYLLLGRVPEALERLKLSLSLQRTAFACSLISAALRSQHSAASALSFAREATTLDADDSGMWLELGDCESMIHGHADQARRAYAEAARVQREALATNITDGPGWILLGLCEAKIGAIDAARAHLRKGDSLPSNDMDTQMYKARLLETLGQRDAALSTLASCLRRGATTVQIDLIPEMEPLEADPRYRQILRTLPNPRTT